MDKVVHFEIPAEDVERAKKFYKTAFDWAVNAVPEMEYTILTTTPIDEKNMPKEVGAINGGMMKRSDPLKSPVITINVADVDEALKKIEHLGVKTVIPKMKVDDMGYSAYFKDTEGNILGLWQSLR